MDVLGFDLIVEDLVVPERAVISFVKEEDSTFGGRLTVGPCLVVARAVLGGLVIMLDIGSGV